MRLFDLHCDTLYKCCRKGGNLEENTGQLDWKRGHHYSPWVQVMAAWIPDTARGEAAWNLGCSMLHFAHEQVDVYPDHWRMIRAAEDLPDQEEKNGPARMMLAVEGGAVLGGKLDRLQDLAELGVRMITLTWNGSNELGNGCASGSEEGLTPLGKEAVRRMESLGILPDVSHLNEAGFWDVAEIANGPFVATHSVSAVVHPHPRNLTDAQFRTIRDCGGLVGLNLCADHLGEQSFERLERHWEHYLSLGGESTVAFGCDLDGTDLPEDWQGIAVMERLYAYFLRRNYSQDWLDRLFFQNARDFFDKALTSRGPVD